MTDTITTLDRYKNSPSAGAVLEMVVALIDKPRAGYTHESITGAVAHGQVVKVLDKQQAHSDIWCKVACDPEKDGVVYHQEGWCKRQFLEVEGESYFDQEWNK